MTKEEAQNYIYTNIPITKAMGFNVVELSSEAVRLTAPIKNNINHRGSAFGGSVDSLFLTTGWAFIRFLIDHYSPTPIIVGHRGSTTFLKPILTKFEAQLIVPPNEEVKIFLNTFERFGKARITLEAVIEDKGEKFAVFKGDYVVVKSKE